MARRYGPLSARDVLYGENSPPGKLVAEARRALADEDYGVALLFFCRAKDREGLAEMKGLALDWGDAFILRAVEEALEEGVSEGDWKALIARAKELGKDAMADLAEKRLRGEDAAPEASPEGEPVAEA